MKHKQTNKQTNKKALFTENNIGDKGAKMLSETLKINTSLTKLHLGDNAIGGAGKAIGGSLKTNSTLIELNLSGSLFYTTNYIYLKFDISC